MKIVRLRRHERASKQVDQLVKVEPNREAKQRLSWLPFRCECMNHRVPRKENWFLHNYTRVSEKEMNRRGDRVRDPREEILLETNFDDDGSAVTKAYNTSYNSQQPLQPQLKVRRNGFRSEQSLDRYSVHGRGEGISFICVLILYFLCCSCFVFRCCIC